MSDLRHALRTLRRAPLFTLVAVVTLALGLGANTAIFSVVNAVLLTPLPLRAPEELVFLQGRSPQGHGVSVSIPNFRDWGSGVRSFASIGGFRTGSVVLTGQEVPERLAAIQVYGDLFGTLGVPPLLGRTIPAAQTEPGGEQVAVLAHGFWQRRFGGDPGVVGRALTLDGRTFTVAGVMPADFLFPSSTADLYVPMGAFADGLRFDVRNDHPGLYAVARLREGATLAAGQQELDAVMARVRAAEGYENAAEAQSLRERALGAIEPTLLVLWGAVGLVLLIACANVANLLLARGEGRARELAVRTALGAARPRLLRQLLTESLLLGAAGGAAGIALGAAGVRALVASLPAGTPGAERITLDLTTLLFAVGLALLTSVLSGLYPALRATGAALQPALRDGGRGAGTGVARQRARATLVVAEQALAVVLLVAAGLMLRSVAGLQRVDPGFTPDRVLTARVALPAAQYGSPDRWQPFYAELLARVRAIPGVEQAALNNGVPLGGSSSESMALPEGRPVRPHEGESALWQATSAGYFEAMRIPLLRGRTFTEADRDGAPLVAVIDERLAEAFWPGEDPIGKRVAMEYVGDMHGGGAEAVWREVVGVVANVRHYELQSRSRPQLYMPYEQRRGYRTATFAPALALFVRTAGDPAATTDAVRRIVRELDPNLPLYAVRTMDEVVDGELATPRLLGGLLGVFATVALTLAAVGLYGVMAYLVSLRTHELGVRLALGARPAQVVRLVVGRGAWLTALGLGVGLAAAWAASRALAGTLYGVTPGDPATFAAIPALLGAVALLASWLPARRAARIPPVEALRGE